MARPIISSGKTAIITGASRGIGRAIALRLAEEGARVVLCARDAAALAAVADEIGDGAAVVPLDLRLPSSPGELVRLAVERFGRVDVFVNNAALNIRAPLLEAEVADVERVWAVSLWGVFHCTQVAARMMVGQGSGGVVVMVSSVHAEWGYANSTAYNGAKAAVNQMARTWAGELAPHRIRVNCVEPGWTDTPGERQFFTEEQIQEQGARLPWGRLARPEEIATAISYLVAAPYVTGSVLKVDGGLTLP